MDEVDAGVRGAAARCVVEQPNTLLAQPLGECIDVTDPVGQLLQTGTALVDELRDRRRLVDRRHQLHLRAALRSAAYGQHRLADALLLVDLLVQHDHAQMIVIPLDGHVQVRHGDADVIDGGDQRGGQHRTGVSLLGGHNAKVT